MKTRVAFVVLADVLKPTLALPRHFWVWRVRPGGDFYSWWWQFKLNYDPVTCDEPDIVHEIKAWFE